MLWYGGMKKKVVAPSKGFPTIEEVERVDKEQLARWYRFLPYGETAAHHRIMRRAAGGIRQVGRHDFRTQRENWDVTELQSRATLSIAVLHPRCELALQITSIKSGGGWNSISALFPASDQAHARRYKAPHSMGRIPPSPPFFLVCFP